MCLIYIYISALLLYTTSSRFPFFVRIFMLWRKEWMHYFFARTCKPLQLYSRTDTEYKRREEFSRKGLNPLKYIKYPLKILFNSIYAYYTILLSIQATADVLKTAFRTPQLLLVVYASVRACTSTILVGRCTIYRILL